MFRELNLLEETDEESLKSRPESSVESDQKKTSAVQHETLSFFSIEFHQRSNVNLPHRQMHHDRAKQQKHAYRLLKCKWISMKRNFVQSFLSVLKLLVFEVEFQLDLFERIQFELQLERNDLEEVEWRPYDLLMSKNESSRLSTESKQQNRFVKHLEVDDNDFYSIDQYDRFFLPVDRVNYEEFLNKSIEIIEKNK